MLFRSDTAGIRDTKEQIEIIGIERTYQKLKQASVVIMVLDATRPEFFAESLHNVSKRLNKRKQKLVILLNKSEKITSNKDDFKPFLNVTPDDLLGVPGKLGDQLRSIADCCKKEELSPIAVIPISAQNNQGIKALKELLANTQKDIKVDENAVLVTNIRHYQALREAQLALDRVEDGRSEERRVGKEC